MQAVRIQLKQAIRKHSSESARHGVHAREQPESESDIVLWIQCGHVEHTDLGESRFRSPYEKPQGYQSATVGDRRVTHAQASPESDLYSDEPSYADTSSQDDHKRLQRNVCGGEQGQRIRNVVGFKIGVFNERTGCDETYVRFIDATELHDTIRLVCARLGHDLQ